MQCSVGTEPGVWLMRASGEDKWEHIRGCGFWISSRTSLASKQHCPQCMGGGRGGCMEGRLKQKLPTARVDIKRYFKTKINWPASVSPYMESVQQRSFVNQTVVQVPLTIKMRSWQRWGRTNLIFPVSLSVADQLNCQVDQIFQTVFITLSIYAQAQPFKHDVIQQC